MVWLSIVFREELSVEHNWSFQRQYLLFQKLGALANQIRRYWPSRYHKIVCLQLFIHYAAPSEWATNMQRDMLASHLGHEDMIYYCSVAENQSIARTRYDMLEVWDSSSLNAWEIMHFSIENDPALWRSSCEGRGLSCVSLLSFYVSLSRHPFL